MNRPHLVLVARDAIEATPDDEVDEDVWERCARLRRESRRARARAPERVERPALRLILGGKSVRDGA